MTRALSRPLPLLVLLALLAGGCAENAVLEIELELPPRPAGEFPSEDDVYAFVQIRDSELPFVDGWAREPRDYAGTLLEPGGDGTTVRYSAISNDEDVTIHMKVRFCHGSDLPAQFCGGDDELSSTARAVWYRIEQPFYMGERTHWRGVIEAVPPGQSPDTREPNVVDKCDIEGCIDATPGTRMFCRIDGTHFCE